MNKEELMEYLENCTDRYERIAAEHCAKDELHDMNFYDGKAVALREVVLQIKYVLK